MKNIKTINYAASKVTEIKSNTFSNCIALTEVLTSDGMKKIGKNAFQNCDNLREVEISSSINSIDVESFTNCPSLIDLRIDENNTTYSSVQNMLLNKNRDKLIRFFPYTEKRTNIPSSIKTIGTKAFAGCEQLELIEIPTTVTTIEDEAFTNCTGLMDIIIRSENITIGNDILKDSVITIKNSINSSPYFPAIITATMTQGNIFYSDTGISTNLCTYIQDAKKIIVDESTIEKQGRASITINSGKLAGLICYIEPEKYDVSKQLDGSIYATINSDGILEIEGNGEMRQWQTNNNISSWHDFINANRIKKVYISGNVTNIANGTFENCINLEEVILGEKITSIGERAFKNCMNLVKISIPDSLETIGYEAFKGCTKLSEIEIENNSQKYVKMDGILFSKDMTELVLVPYGRFDLKDEVKYAIPSTVTKIRNNAFSMEDIKTTIYAPDTIQEIEAKGMYSQNNKIFIYCKAESKVEEYAKSIGLKYYAPSSSIFIMADIDDGAEQLVKAKNHKVVLTVLKSSIGMNEEDYKYVWTQSNKQKPEKSEFINKYTPGTEIVEDSLHGTWYLWAMAKDILGNEEVGVSKAIEFDNAVDLTDEPISITVTENGNSKEYRVIITAEEEIQPVEGWQLSQDKMKLTKIYTQETEEVVRIKDLLENTRDVTVKVKATSNTDEPDDNQKPDDNQTPGDNQKPDDNQTPGDNQKPDDNQNSENNEKPDNNQNSNSGSNSVNDKAPSSGSENNSSGTNTNKNNSTMQEESGMKYFSLPKTGIQRTFIILIILLSMSAVVFYIKYKKIN